MTLLYKLYNNHKYQPRQYSYNLLTMSKTTQDKPTSSKTRYFVLIAFVIAIILGGWVLLHYSHPKPIPAPNSELAGQFGDMRKTPQAWFLKEKDISSLVSDIRTNQVANAGLGSDVVLITTKQGVKYFVADTTFGRVGDLVLSAYKQETKEIFPVVFLEGIKHYADGKESSTGLMVLEIAGRATSMLFMLAMGIGLYLFIKQSKENSFELTKGSTLRFADVIGAGEAKEAVSDIVAYLKNPATFSDIGARPPHGVLMVGPPGTGKTRLAQAMAGECGVSFIALNGSDFSSKYYGVAIQRVKTLFKLARKNAPCIVFIDEIDGVGKRTTSSDSPAAAESNRIVNQILVEMDGFKAGDGVIVMGATNLVEMLDDAMLREGRFDRRIHIKMPELLDRQKLFELYAKQIQSENNIDFQQLARLTTGLSPATIAAIVNQSALLAAKDQRQTIGMPHYLEAIEISRMGGLAGGAKALSSAEKRRVAVHEAGHAFIAHKLKVGRVEKVTILPRGGALGVTLVTQEEDKHLHLQSELENRIVMLLGGRCAELLLLKEASTGAAEDLKEASRIALAMVNQFGFGGDNSLFSSGALTGQVPLAKTEADIGQATVILAEQEQLCFTLLAQSREALDCFIEKLIIEETLPGSAVQDALSASKLKVA